MSMTPPRSTTGITESTEQRPAGGTPEQRPAGRTAPAAAPVPESAAASALERLRSAQPPDPAVAHDGGQAPPAPAQLGSGPESRSETPPDTGPQGRPEALSDDRSESLPGALPESRPPDQTRAQAPGQLPAAGAVFRHRGHQRFDLSERLDEIANPDWDQWRDRLAAAAAAVRNRLRDARQNLAERRRLRAAERAAEAARKMKARQAEARLAAARETGARQTAAMAAALIDPSAAKSAATAPAALEPGTLGPAPLDPPAAPAVQTTPGVDEAHLRLVRAAQAAIAEAARREAAQDQNAPGQDAHGAPYPDDGPAEDEPMLPFPLDPPAGPDPEPERLDQIRRITVSVSAVLCTVGGLAGSGVFGGDSIREAAGGVFDPDFTYLSPGAGAFAIWLPIYLGLLVFAVYQWLPHQLSTLRQRRLGWLVAVSMLLNLCWVLSARAALVGLSTLVMTALLAVLLYAVHWMNRYPARGTLERRATDTPLGLYTGWIMVAFFANVAVWLAGMGALNSGFSGQLWAFVMLGVITVAGSVVGMSDRGRVSVGLAIGWGLVWILVQRTLGDHHSVLIAIGSALAAFLVIVTAESRRHRLAHAQRRLAMGKDPQYWRAS